MIVGYVVRGGRAAKLVASTGLLAVIAGASLAVVLHDDSAQTNTTSQDVPLLNPDLIQADLVHLTPSSRTSQREALTEGEPVTFTLLLGDDSREITTEAATLADALTEAGVELGWEDEVSADLSSPPPDGGEVRIGVASTEFVTEPVTTPFAVEERPSDELTIGETQVIQEGSDGEAQVTSEVRRLDGVEVSRTTVMSVQTAAAVPQIVEVGTAPEVPVAPKLYTLGQFMSAGRVNWGGYQFTYYSQSVLPGGGLNIPGRHVNEDGYVADGDGYIVLANSAPKGTIIDTPFGYQGKVYDRGTVGNHYDVYIR